MGVLDDAIREHLELKRRHGVPDEEVERQEEEALGPARREVAQQPEDAEIAADAADDSTLFDGEPGDAPVADAPASGDDETAIAEPPAEQAPALEEPPPTEQPPAPVEPVEAEVAPAETVPEEVPAAEPPVADHTGLEPPPETDPHDALGDTEPHGFPALEDDEPHEDLPEETSHEEPSPASVVDEDEHEDDVEDVLEDTPDFLQETPEHDRLWFEQKPPRDFDFD